ncbi:alpha/beta fold hydrolase [Edaphobacter modestus]|uniref:alpha/beta fold hydrolase n=1 Tax=Edaphobacter modestus TaxID=388466 RepID=UPI0013EE4F05|nr:alpha/beta fold hydrolase [Edaphobacter modestus]
MTIDSTNIVYEFGPFRLELNEHRLLREGHSIPLTGKAFDTLRVLLERHGTLVSKQDLMTAVWPSTQVEENNLDRNISALRKALGGQASGKPFIETVPRAGYRFIAPVAGIPLTAMNRRAEDRAKEMSPRQEIRFCLTPDNVRIAYATVGSGHPIVRVANCFNHLDFEWGSPIWRHWVRDLAKGHSIVRYDGRGNGLSERDVEDFSLAAWVQDLETVVDAAGLDTFALMGHSQGSAVAIVYAVRHPERVSHLILCGAYSRGACHREKPDLLEARRALEKLVELNFGESNPSFFQLVTSFYIPEGATPEEQDWFKDLQLISVSSANLVKFMRACDEIDVRALLPKVSVPTIVFHSDGDRVAPPEEGRIVATEISNARFVPLSSGNHFLLSEEPAWKSFREELASFLKSTDLSRTGT